jgi:hypothetical protein
MRSTAISPSPAFCSSSRVISRTQVTRCRRIPRSYRLIARFTSAFRFDKVKVESAIYHLCTFEGQMRCNPPPLARVMFREEVRPLMWQLLGPAPEQEDAFWRHPDGTPAERPKKDTVEEEKQSEPEKKARKPSVRGR